MTPGPRRLLTALLGVVLVVTALPPAADAAARRPGPSAPGVIVKLKPGGDRNHRIDDVMQRFGLGLQRRSTGSGGIYLLRSTDPAAAADPTRNAALARSVAASDDVEYAEPNMVGGLLAASGFHAWPDGPPSAVGASSAAWSTQAAATDLKLVSAQLLSRGRGVKVAVIDTGVAAHPALAGKVRSGWDYVDDDATPDDPSRGVDSSGNGVPDEAAGHGTFVAGTVALVAPEARLTAYRVLDSDGLGTTFDAAEAITDAADAGAKVINLSFGTVDGATSQVLEDAITYARGRGAVVVAAAGNTGDSEETFPAALPTVLSVGALAVDDTGLASFSARGGWVKVAAPGESIVGPMPGGGFARWSGTSMAAPFVAGQVALVWAKTPWRGSSSVSDAVTRSSSTASRRASSATAPSTCSAASTRSACSNAADPPADHRPPCGHIGLPQPRLRQPYVSTRGLPGSILRLMDTYG